MEGTARRNTPESHFLGLQVLEVKIKKEKVPGNDHHAAQKDRLPLLLYMVLSPLRGGDAVHFGEHRDEVVIGVARHFGNRID